MKVGNSENPFTEMRHVSVITRDIKQTVASFMSLGIGPFERVRFPLGKPIGEMSWRGRPISAKLWISASQLGPIQLEVIQPLEGESSFTEFMSRRGEGMQHICFGVTDVDAVVDRFARNGIAVLQTGKFEYGGFAYMDTAAIGGVVLEMEQKPLGEAEVQPTLQSEISPPFEQFNEVGIIVHDIDSTAEYYSLLGFGPFWPVEVGFTGVVLRGKPVEFSARTKLTNVGQVLIRLIEILEGETILQEFLERGEGLHYLGFSVDSVDEEVARLSGKGFSVIERGSTTAGEEYAYIDTRVAGGVVIKLIQPAAPKRR